MSQTLDRYAPLAAIVRIADEQLVLRTLALGSVVSHVAFGIRPAVGDVARICKRTFSLAIARQLSVRAYNTLTDAFWYSSLVGAAGAVRRTVYVTAGTLAGGSAAGCAVGLTHVALLAPARVAAEVVQTYGRSMAWIRFAFVVV